MRTLRCPGPISDRNSVFSSVPPNIWSFSQCLLLVLRLSDLHFSPDWPRPIQSTVAKEWHHCCVSKEEINSTVPKTLQIFLTRRWMAAAAACAPFEPRCGSLSPDGRLISVTVEVRGGLRRRQRLTFLWAPTDASREFFFSQAAERRHLQKKGFNNKQTRGRGYLNHAEKNPSGLDWLTNERHVMLILHFTLQTITQTPGALSAHWLALIRC